MASDTSDREYRIQDVSSLVESVAPEPTLGQLVAKASRDASEIVRAEIALAKAEIAQSAKAGGTGAGMFAGAAFFGLFGLGFLVALGLSTWLAFLIVAVVLFVLALILALVGKKALAQAKPVPEKAIASAQETIATLKGRL